MVGRTQDVGLALRFNALRRMPIKRAQAVLGRSLARTLASVCAARESRSDGFYTLRQSGRIQAVEVSWLVYCLQLPIPAQRFKLARDMQRAGVRSTRCETTRD
jgi:hypothetical protein